MSENHFSRREFARLTALAGAAIGVAVVGFGPTAFARLAAISPEQPDKQLSILILGGTGFSGPKMAEYAKSRGHKVTLFNRGRTEKRIGMVEDVGHLYGNRDPDKNSDEADPDSPKGLTQLEGKRFDAIIDTSGFYPRHVKASAELLKDSGYYLFISTVSVYEGNSKPADENDELGKVEDTTTENMGAQMERYGPLKVLCEKEVQRVFGDRCSIVRPGFIVGPGDPSDRFTYWPVRASEGGEMLCPGDGSDPVQFIDNRDLAEWCVRLCETRTPGVFNAIGPDGMEGKKLNVRGLVEACIAASAATGGKKATPVWVPFEFLEEQQVSVGGDLPIIIPSTGEAAGFHRRSNARAVAAGLTYRPVEDTCQATLEWWPKEVARRERVGNQLVEEAKKAGKEPPRLPDPTKLGVGMSREREAQILKAWKESKG
ncbi:MAG: NAD-dependent epimerase/dehydratase family protein [Phycisphaeraceae bacterium]|nr:NAD-dependent epimerase/dehydratase family protein [Phycisphaeraceae bacterium]